MAKNSITDYSKTAASNTDIQSVDIDEGCLPSGINNAIRELMADLADMNDGTVTLTSPSFAAATITGALASGSATVGSTTSSAAVHSYTKLEIESSSHGALQLSGSTGAEQWIWFADDSSSTPVGGITYYHGGPYMAFRVEGSERMRIDSSGNVKIGSSLTDGKLGVYGDSLNFSPSADNSSNGIGCCILGSSVADAGAASARLYMSGANSAHAGNLDLRSGSVIESTLNMYAVSGTKTVFLTTNGNSYINGGSLGIGTSSPSNPLHIVGSGSTPFATQRNVNSGGFAMIQGKMGDSASTSAGHVYSALVAGIEDNTNGAEDGYFAIEVSEGGSGSEKLRVTSSGQVGIGTSSPDSSVEISKSGGGSILSLNRSNTNTTGRVGAINFTASDGHSVSAIQAVGDGNNEGAHLVFYTTSAASSADPTTNERMRITSSGQVDIATSSGNGYLAVPQAYAGVTSSAVNMHILSSGVFLRSTSSGRYKTGVEDAEMSYAEELYNLRPVYYKSLGTFDNPDHSHWGFIAEEVAEIDPRLCLFKTTEPELDDDGNTQYDDDGNIVETTLDEPVVEGVQYDRMIPLLLMLLKEQKQQIEDLEARVATLEGN